MKKVDKIGYWMGEPISEMSRPKLLKFAEWAGKEIIRLQYEKK